MTNPKRLIDRLLENEKAVCLDAYERAKMSDCSAVDLFKYVYDVANIEAAISLWNTVKPR